MEEPNFYYDFNKFVEEEYKETVKNIEKGIMDSNILDKDNLMNIFSEVFKEVISLNYVFKNFKNVKDEFKKKLEEYLYQNEGFNDILWENFFNSMDNWLNEERVYLKKEFKISDYYKVQYVIEGSNMGWRHNSSTGITKIENGKYLVTDILPRTNMTIHAFKQKDGSLKLTVYHHDAPTGEFYTINSVLRAVKKELDEASNDKIKNFIKEQIQELNSKDVFARQNMEGKDEIIFFGGHLRDYQGNMVKLIKSKPELYELFLTVAHDNAESFLGI